MTQLNLKEAIRIEPTDIRLGIYAYKLIKKGSGFGFDLIQMNTTQINRAYKNIQEGNELFISAIPLTAAWLKKLGFSISEEDGLIFATKDIFKLRSFDYDQKKWFVVQASTLHEKVSDSCFSIAITTVHSLQNIHLTLTGQDLKL